MSNGSRAPSVLQRIVIHHLSDLHYEQQQRKNGVDPLVRYGGFLDELPADRRPDLLVITGDVTATGAASDLRTVAEILRNGFPKWAKELAQHIVVVPGPRDINWEGPELPGLTSFYDSLHDFALPSARHTTPEHGTTPRPNLDCITYPFDTCYSLEECSADMKNQFHRYGETYHAFVQRYQQVGRKVRRRFLCGRSDRKREFAALRARYLDLTEANELTLLDAGRVHVDDLRAFDEWAKPWASGQSAGSSPRDPLKILITHHPLVVQPAPNDPSKAGRAKDDHLEQLATSARAAGFHLALHGHIHKPQVLSDLSLMEGPDVRHPMRQVGAGSLGDGGTFNEITAIYTREGEQGQWRLEIRTINLAAEQSNQASSFMLLNPATAAKSPEQLVLDKRRQEFDARVGDAMRQFSDAVYRTQPESGGDRTGPLSLPQAPLLTVDSIIRDIVFPRRDPRVRLFLKELRMRPVPKLSAVYLAPPYGEGSAGPVQYPVSIAALSLLLGRTLTYPKVLDERLDEQDYKWLRRSFKDRALDKTLDALFQETLGSSYPGPEGAPRYGELRSKLARWFEDPKNADAVYGRDFYQEAPPPQSGQQPYPYFICVPFPLRPRGTVVPDVPEVAVLVVGVKASEEHEREDSSNTQVTPEETFTPERIGMLESLAELTGTILVTSSALGKPKGVWDDRL